MGFWNIRSLLLAAFVLSNSITWTVSKHHYTHNVLGHRSRHRRQGAGLFLSGSYVIPAGEGSGPWGEWGEVSPCSRTCGGGVASQKRICLEVDPYGRPQCTGADTKYFSCETQDCPEGSKDFRAEQCSEYDNQPFRGVTYSKWVPYTRAPNPCLLTCMPHAERFYRPIKNVIDGTRCHDDSFDVCVNGTCQPVGCDMMLGSNAQEDKCRECRGNGTNCRTVTGLVDTQDLRQGYNDILLIPQGSTTISIQEKRPSNNYLAIRGKTTNEYYLNGHYHISSPQTFPIAGSNCRYDRSELGYAAVDILKCLGPINETVYLSLLLLQDDNVGIEYEYSLPTSLAPPPDQEYAWVHDEFSPCSATCGGGIQTRKVTCRSREELEEVEDRLCDINLKPATNQICGSNPCQARWVEGPWSDCSKPCGQGGVRSRQVHCEKIISNGNPSLVNDEECFGLLGPKPEIFQECNKDAACPSWFTGPWKPCDKLIGEGKQTRQVVCHQKIDGKVEVLAEDACTDKKPPAEQPCLLHPSEGVDWVLSDWAGCDNCLSKTRSRIAECVTKDRNIVNASFCAYHPTPILEEKCDENELPACTFQWYATQWSNCSVECGKGVQTRRVFCGRFNGESVSKVDDEKCESEDKYKETKDCEVPEEKCPAKWFAGPWTECSKMCGRGERHRKIMCLSRGKVVKTCDPETILDEDETCNDIPCDEDETLPLDSRTTPIIDDDEDYDEDCEDEEYVDTPKDWDLMFSDSPSTTDEGSGESTLFTESESDLTSETGSGTETTFETSSDTSLSTETGSTESSSDYDTTEIITTESGLTEDTSITSSESDVTLSSSTETITTGETVTESSTTSDSETQSSESTATGITESDATTETGTTESDSSETTETGTTGSDSFETTETGTTESDSSETTEMGTTGSDSSETTETGTTESDSSETTETGTTETDSSETTETGITESDSSATTETATTELDSSETTETGTTESDSFDTSETVTTELESSETTVTDTTDSNNSASTETGSTESGSTDTTESATTEIDSSETTETGTTESEISESTESGSTGSEITDITDTSTDASNTGSTEETSSESSSESTTEIGSTDTADTSSTGTDDTSSTESTITDSVATDETESTETEDTSGTDESTTPWDWTTVVEEFTKRPRKCKRRKAPKCKKSTFGCCPDEITPAAGPFDGGCPTFTTCKETKFGCCPDGVSQARGPNNHGCPISQCKETLYGCCKSDKKTPAEGNNQEGCPPPPPACKSSKNGCCKDGKTAAKGPKGKGCPENKPDIKDTEATLNDCAESEFGCCFDNETQATGPNEEGCPCNATEFNCCPDGITPARGLQMEGCVTSCNTTEFGCCPDNETPAHGPEQEGCCLQYAFGCCPDNYKPAEGPHLEGCECQHAHFGCCPDNKTIARGPGNEGCGCQHTQHGCCPDRHTEATGPDFEGCACHTFQFGCCPDGVTKSTGPGLTGCRCQYSQYGCCGDDETAATGPNKEGCNCANSKFGCCPDGETEAKGEKFLGCTDKPENRQAACALATDRGPCHNYTVYWFYDKEYGGCSRFWYGGCGGNGNKFVSNEECQSVCVQPSPKEACQLPKVHGACESYIPKWYYDTEREQCGQFIYGGCLGNANNFETRDACRSQCEPARDEDTCTLPIESGSCAGSYERWGFNAQAGRCERFVWGGCEGNTNKFTTEAACIQRCDPPGAQKPQCSVPQDVGNCTSKIATWSFSETENRCVPFYYSGCGGNENRFTREQDCTQACPTIPVQDVCTKPASVGDCADYREKWYYDTAVKRCRPFYYGGCGGNGNNFNSEQECENSCSENALTTTTNPPPPRYDQEYCFLELDPGPCNMMRTMYGYDSSLGRCVAFQYGGCGGNTNNFERIEDCERYCSNAQDVCQLPKSTGVCRASITMWYYDASSDSCRQFQYGGCDGNANRFESRGDCERRCRAAPIAPTTPTPVRATTQAVSQECRTPDSLTPCGENITVFYYDAERRECLGGYFGGCRYTNSYRSSEECERRCGAFRDQDVCAAQKDPGPCRAAVPKFYFDRASSRCLEFTYGGCYGSSNRFSTQDECEEVCGIPETDPCQLQPEPGNCLEAVEMWYYDANRDQCGQFYYSGCQGNGNRFNSQAECEGRCRSRAPLVTTVPPAQQSSEECRTPASLAPCGENITVFYYDAEKQQCLSGSFGGCRYANSYRSSEECERRCGAFRDIDVCAAQVDPGPCRDNITKFYFDSASGRCTEFGYGGCYGSSNRFSTQDECKEVCGGAGPEAACLEQLSRGAPCGGAGGDGGASEGALRRWYYSVDDADCRAFIYEGCDGNNNNFGSYQECEDRCLPGVHEPDCSELEQECASLRCEYSVQRTHTADGCEKCTCVTVDVDCTPLIEQCATLKCHYEIDKVMGPDGCERCRCTEHPCEKVHCPSGERCVAIPYRDPITQAVKYNANCKMVNKPGVCVAEEARDNLAASSCRRECNDDADCDDAGKCCARGCSQLCESPAMPTSAAPTTLPPTRPTPPIYPELPQAPQANLEATEPEVSSSEGGKATLRCFFHGNPPPTITWRRGEITIDGNVGRYRILSDGTLEIVSLYRNDTGVYICVGDNGLGTAKQEVRLQVTDPVDREAEIAGEDNASETGELGQPLTLRCLAYGYPAPSINWYHGPNGGTMVPFDSVLYETTRDGHLLIRSLNLETLGEYSCHAYNGQGRATSWNVMVRAWAPLGYRNYANNPYIYEREVQVTPRPPTTQPTQPPTTTPPPIFTAPVHTRIMSESGTVAAGSELSLPCEVDGYPAPRVHWTKDGSLLSPSARITITDARLTIAGLREDDSGEYGCHARNDYSSYDSTISIQVRGITIPEQCTDNPFFANCHLIVKSNFCTHSYYSKFCCKSCVEAGQLNPALLRLDETWQYRK